MYSSINSPATVMGSGPSCAPPSTSHSTIDPASSVTMVRVVRVDVIIPPLTSTNSARNMNPLLPMVRDETESRTSPPATPIISPGGGDTVQRMLFPGRVQVKVTESSDGQATGGVAVNVPV